VFDAIIISGVEKTGEIKQIFGWPGLSSSTSSSESNEEDAKEKKKKSKIDSLILSSSQFCFPGTYSLTLHMSFSH